MNRLSIAVALLMSQVNMAQPNLSFGPSYTYRRPYRPKVPTTQADHDRAAAAQAKRDRKANKRRHDSIKSTCKVDLACTHGSVSTRHIIFKGRPVFFSVNAEKEWNDSLYELTPEEEAEAQALELKGIWP